MTALEELRAVISFAQSMSGQVPSVDQALPALRALLSDAAVAYRIVGGVAVLHHGYARTTRDIDVLLESTSASRIDPHLAGHGFIREGPRRLRHRCSGVRIDLLLSGDSIPRSPTHHYPSPAGVTSSASEPDIVALAPLLELKLRAGRRQDEADVVGLLKQIDDGRYLVLEAELPTDLRPRVAELRRDAEEERRWEDGE